MPIIFATVIELGQEREFEYQRLLSGTELYVLSVTILATTKLDLDNSNTDVSSYRLYGWFTDLLLPLAYFIGMAFAAVFINSRVLNIGLSETYVANGGIFLGIFAGVNCILVQMTRAKQARQELRG